MEPGHQLLHKLFRLWQGNPDSLRRKSLPINKDRAAVYYQTVNPDEKDQLHDCLRNAEQDGCVSLVWGKYNDSHSLRKIWLTDGEALARFLNIPLARNIATEAEQIILKQLPEIKPWAQDLLNRIVDQWKKDKSAYRISPGEVDEVIVLIKSLNAVRENRQENLDLRTFSAKFLGDSKAMERMRDRFAKAWNEEFKTGLDGQELYEYLGLIKFPPALFIKGPINVRVGQCWLAVDQVPSYLGIVPDTIEEIELTEVPDYVLTIENLSSFNRHCREIQDNGIVIYTAGFLGPTTVPFLKLMDEKTEKSIPFYHWGDIDIGGMKITRHIQSLLKKKIKLHLMSAEILKKCGKKVDGFSGRLSTSKQSQNPQIESLTENFLANRPYLILEQENIDPVSPL